MKKDNFEQITTREENFSEWYLDVIKFADLAENSPVRGSMVIKPHGYAIWEMVQSFLDKEFKKTGVQNAYFPLLIPLSFLEREAEHVDGFAKECAVVTHHRLEEKDGELVPSGKLDEPYVIRPTSETIIYDTFSKWIRSHRDLPLLINQWANVMRWELRTKPFLRTSEFLWQEGHTAHATKEEADNKTLEMLEVYKDLIENHLAIKVIAGRKTEREKFAGADYTTTLEAMMQDGKALQSCTSHMLGQNFAKSFDVSFVDQNQEKQYAWQTSWGLSTRIIGAIIMSHSDDRGLVLPPRISPLQVVIVPIYKTDEERLLVLTKVNELTEGCELAGVRYKVDGRDIGPGAKYFEWERKGVPLRVEIGPRDAEKNTFMSVNRVTGEKEALDLKDGARLIAEKLAAIQEVLLQNSERRLKENTVSITDYNSFKEYFTNKTGFAYAPLCSSPKCEDDIKEELQVTTRCIPFENTSGIDIEKSNCIKCSQKADYVAVCAKAY